MRPRIGITTSFEELEDSLGEQQLRLEYVEAVRASGGLPLIVPMIQEPDAVDELCDELDGLIMTGGPSVSQDLIGDLPGDLSRNAETRLNTDILLLQRILERDKPFLGICYGMQQLNAYFGGTIYADVERTDAFNLDHLTDTGFADSIRTMDNRLTHSQKRGATTHAIRVLPETHLHHIMQRDELQVNTRHLQAIATAGEGLRISAVAADGVIEGIENQSGHWLGVQFHPERDLEQFLPLFNHFTQLAARHKHAVPS